jgi:GNAT superfamily N-acetyltransferase
MEITLNNEKYLFLKQYQNESQSRSAFNRLANKVFKISFEAWYRTEYWSDKCIPYTLFDDKGEAIANISVNIMDFAPFGQKQRYIQIGTVMTDEQHRNKGLSRFLMEQVLNDLNEKCDFIYLYANKTALNLYPKFGFKRVTEYSYSKRVLSYSKLLRPEKLNMETQANRNLLYDYVKNTHAFGPFSMRHNPDLVMFYCISSLKDAVYYVRSLESIAIATFKGSELHLVDVFGKKETVLEDVIQSLTNTETQKVFLGFTPFDPGSYEILEASSDDVLFIQAGKTKLFDEHQLMFPLLSHA